MHRLKDIFLIGFYVKKKVLGAFIIIIFLRSHEYDIGLNNSMFVVQFKFHILNVVWGNRLHFV